MKSVASHWGDVNTKLRRSRVSPGWQEQWCYFVGFRSGLAAAIGVMGDGKLEEDKRVAELEQLYRECDEMIDLATRPLEPRKRK